MIEEEARPPHWAETMLISVLRPADRESVSGDLLEEYRVARLLALGALRADGWYVKHALSVLWRLVWPFATVLMVQRVLLSLTAFRPGHHAPHFVPPGPTFLLNLVGGTLYASVMPLPGVAFFDALIYFGAGLYAFRRARVIRAGVLAAASSSVVGFIALFGTAALITPGLLLAPFAQPLIFVLLLVYLAIPLGYAMLLGAVGGLIGRCVGRRAPSAEEDARYA